MKCNFYRNTANKILNVINNDIKFCDFNLPERECILSIKHKDKEIIKVDKIPSDFAEILYEIIFEYNWVSSLNYKQLEYFDQMEILVRNHFLNYLIYVDFRMINKDGSLSEVFSYPRMVYKNCIISQSIDLNIAYPKTRFVNCIKET